jgi:hypothetical protein
MDQGSTLEEFLANDNCRRLPVTPPVAARAQMLIREYQLDTCDALILATALTHKATRFITRDNTSLCKRLRSRQRHPTDVKSILRAAPAATDSQTERQRFFEELVKIEIHCASMVNGQPVTTQVAVDVGP